MIDNPIASTARMPITSRLLEIMHLPQSLEASPSGCPSRAASGRRAFMGIGESATIHSWRDEFGSGAEAQRIETLLEGLEPLRRGEKLTKDADVEAPPKLPARFG
ncbi:hypothetical protein [Rhizobium ecuadorense]|uniref:hypothetical protein n=1 Tax=Rhizobium ecuadorense TaxID=1671795 RepID=UPI00128EDD6F|nr:hypothetical protein [Rhizobium ecuadorense]